MSKLAPRNRAEEITDLNNHVSDHELMNELERRGNVIIMVSSEDLRPFYDDDIFPRNASSETQLEKGLQDCLNKIRNNLKEQAEHAVQNIIKNMNPTKIIRNYIKSGNSSADNTPGI